MNTSICQALILSFAIKSKINTKINEKIKMLYSTSFQYLGGEYAKDKNNIYYEGDLYIENVNTGKLEYLGGNYIEHKGKVKYEFY